MFKRIYTSLFIATVFIFTFNSCNFIKTNKIPTKYELSIKSLEQELRICFYMQDKYFDLVNTDVKNLANQRDKWFKTAQDKALLTIKLLDKYNNCEIERDILLKQLSY